MGTIYQIRLYLILVIGLQKHLMQQSYNNFMYFIFKYQMLKINYLLKLFKVSYHNIHI
jgi:hypothetical protein